MGQQHDIYESNPGFSCRRCTLWARAKSMFDLLLCPPPDGR